MKTKRRSIVDRHETREDLSDLVRCVEGHFLSRQVDFVRENLAQ